MQTIAITDYKRSDAVEVNLWSYLFEVMPITKVTEPKLNDALGAINKAYADADFSKHAIQARVFAARMDVRLTKGPGGSRKKASTLIKEHWASGDLTVPQIDQFWGAVEAAIQSGASQPIEIESFAGATVEVDLWGETYEMAKVTAITEPEIDAQLEAIAKEYGGRELTHEEQVRVFGLRFDARLTPAKAGGPKASELVQKKWDASELEVPQLQQFWDAALEASDRPS